MVHIPNVQLELLFPGNGVSAIHLRPARDARHHFVPPRLFGRITGQILHQKGTGTDQAHVAAKDIQKFREFVEAGAAEGPTEESESLGVWQKVSLRIARIGHGAELQNRKRLTPQTGPVLSEQNGRAELPQDQERGYAQKRQPHWTGHENQQKVHRSFHA